MSDSGAAVATLSVRSRGQWLAVVARQRELSLVAIMIVLGGLVTLTAPQFLTVSNLSQVAVLAALIAVAAVGEALVVITRNVDLSVEATMGLVAYCVASLLERHALGTTGAIAFGLGLGLVLGMVNGIVVTVFRVPAIVATLGTLNGTSATGLVLAVVAAVVVGGVNIFGGSGTLVGAALGALFLGFIANALILVGLSQFWLQAIYGLVILLAVSADAIIVRRIQRAPAARRVR